MILQKIVNWFKSKPKNVEQNSLKNEFTKNVKHIKNVIKKFDMNILLD